MRVPIRIIRRLRWFGFFVALSSVVILTTFKINYLQATGWGLSALSCSIWIFDSYRSKHKTSYVYGNDVSCFWCMGYN
jgi:hypothetical protein